MCLTPEANLAREIKFKGEDRLLTGKADYALWYGDGVIDTIIVVVEAKKCGQVSDGIAQGLAYMGKSSSIQIDVRSSHFPNAFQPSLPRLAGRRAGTMPSYTAVQATVITLPFSASIASSAYVPVCGGIYERILT